MRSIFLKSLWNRKDSYLIVVLCGVFQVSVTFFVSAMGDFLSLIVNDRTSDLLDGTITAITFMLTHELLFFLMVLVFLSYIRKRVGDYAVLESLGLKKKHKYMFVAWEFGGVFVVSLGGGLLIGALLAGGLRIGLLKAFSDTVSVLYYGKSVWIMTIVMQMITYISIFIFFDEVIACLGIDALISFGKKNGRSYKRRVLLSAAGPAVMLISFVSMGFYWGKGVEEVPTSAVLAGLFLFMVTSVGNYLERLKGNGRLYYKRLVWLDQWYQQFYYNINTVFITAAFLFIINFTFSVSLLDCLPVNTPENFPYDLVWMANEEDREFLDSLRKEYHLEVEEYPCFRAATGDYAEQMAISAETYEQWTGESLELKGREIYVVYQRDRADRNHLGIDYNTKNPDIYIGNARADLWLYIQGEIVPGAEFDNDYKIIGYEDRVLTGIFGTAEQENIIVFSDEYYQKVCGRAKGADLAVLMKIPDRELPDSAYDMRITDEETLGGSYDAVAQKVYDYAETHSQTDFFSLEDTPLIYEKRQLLKEDQREKLFGAVSNGLNILILFLCTLFIFGLKMENDLAETEQKYKLYFQSGMPPAKCRRTVRKEIMAQWLLSLAFGLLISGIFAAEKVYLKRMTKFWNVRYGLGLLALMAGMTAIFGIFAAYAVRRSYKRMERGWEDG